MTSKKKSQVGSWDKCIIVDNLPQKSEILTRRSHRAAAVVTVLSKYCSPSLAEKPAYRAESFGYP